MVVFPNCKINLGLHITRKREDGYHNLVTIFYPLPLRDVLEVIGSRKSEDRIQRLETENAELKARLEKLERLITSNR